jgi:hypothetical protein
MGGLTKPRSKRRIKFPFVFEKNGRTGKIYFLKKTGTFKSYFWYAGKPFQNTFKAFSAAYGYLEREFSTIDANRANSLALNPLNGDVKNYAELEQLVREKGNGASLREAVNFFIAYNATRAFKARTVSDCTKAYLEFQADKVKIRKLSSIHLETLEKHLRRFETDFGTRHIHEITTLEIINWLKAQRSRKKPRQLWNAKTRTNVTGSLASLSVYAREILKAIPELGKTEFEKVPKDGDDEAAVVEIYTPQDMSSLFAAALQHDIDLIPGLVAGSFQGLRPDEFHAENADRKALTWEEFIWHDGILQKVGQKVRSKVHRDIPLQPATVAWLEPFKRAEGTIWNRTSSYGERMRVLAEKAKVNLVYDGFRRSYASYRIRQLNGNIATLAYEMGNSPSQIVKHYKKNVTDQEAELWFGILPPKGYVKKIKAALVLR